MQPSIPRPAPTHKPAPPRQPVPKRKAPQKQKKRPLWLSPWLLMLGAVLLVSTCAAVGLGSAVVVAAGRIPPNVTAMGVNLSLMTEAEAAATLRNRMGAVTLRDGPRTWTVAASELGLLLDADATAARAADVPLLDALAPVTVTPAVSVNAGTLRDALTTLSAQVELPPRDAGFRLFNGAVQPVPAEVGRRLDVEATVNALAANPGAALADGGFDLVVAGVAPAVMDATPLVEQARALLASPLVIDAYDPIADETVTTRVDPTTWAAWLTADATGTQLALQTSPVAGYIDAQLAPQLAAYQRIDSAEAAAQVSAAVSNMQPYAQVRVRQTDKVHTVQAGETITRIAWDYGVPYPHVQQANPGIDTLSAGMQLTIPSPEVFLPYPVVPDKRIVVSISGNWTRVYENGRLKWDWVSSTGINSSPTWPGVYQIISHEPDAYAGNWNLNMPWFLGVYQPVPGSAFTNGFHGFPTRGGGQLLWENSLGTKVTYGCILLSTTNAKLLYDWAEDGVVVEILP